MEGLCAKCKTQLEPHWKFCSQCGAVITEEAEAPVQAQMQVQVPAGVSEQAPVRGAFTGLLFGLLVAPVMLIVGTMLCLTGLGAVVGVPMILGGIMAPLLGPMMGIGALKGKCPWCGAPVTNVLKTHAFHCHSCGQRITVVNRRFMRAEDKAA